MLKAVLVGIAAGFVLLLLFAAVPLQRVPHVGESWSQRQLLHSLSSLPVFLFAGFIVSRLRRASTKRGAVGFGIVAGLMAAASFYAASLILFPNLVLLLVFGPFSLFLCADVPPPWSNACIAEILTIAFVGWVVLPAFAAIGGAIGGALGWRRPPQAPLEQSVKP